MKERIFLLISLDRALQPPNWKQSFLVGVRVAANKKLVAFISGVPVALKTYEK